MIIQEILPNGLVKTYSDAGKYIIQQETDIKYSEAVDVPNKYTYIESEELVEVDEKELIEIEKVEEHYVE